MQNVICFFIYLFFFMPSFILFSRCLVKLRRNKKAARTTVLLLLAFTAAQIYPSHSKDGCRAIKIPFTSIAFIMDANARFYFRESAMLACCCGMTDAHKNHTQSSKQRATNSSWLTIDPEVKYYTRVGCRRVCVCVRVARNPQQTLRD